MEFNIGARTIGNGHPCYVVAEIGINHNGDLEIAKQLIAAAAAARCDAVKFQKRTVDVVYSAEELARPRESPFGTTNGDLKRGLEFGEEQYDDIYRYCQLHAIEWFASCWDKQAVDFIARYDLPAFKIASACITDLELVRYTADSGRPIIASTGMSTIEQIGRLVEAVPGDLALLHCVATYPAHNEDLDLRCIQWLADEFHVPVGYSGHEVGLATTIAAVAMGACIVERHITLDRSMFGSDQAASLEPHAISRLVRDIRAVEQAMGDGVKRVLPAEEVIAAKLRRIK